MNRKVVDAFIFYNELELLEFRLTELYEVIDHFIIVESTKTFVGNEKELFFDKNRFAKFIDKIVYIVVDDFSSNDPWENETRQRNAISEGVAMLDLAETDIIIISDVDEIPDPDRLLEIKFAKEIFEYYTFHLDFYYYNLTCKFVGYWGWVKAVTKRYYDANKCPQHIRNMSIDPTIIWEKGSVVEPGGWHLSYFGGIERIKNKIQNFSHQEFNTKEILDEIRIRNRIENRIDLFDREIFYENVPLDKNQYLPKNYIMLI